MTKLPIEVSSRPGCFLWRQEIDTLGGKRTVDHEGPVTPSVDTALRELIKETKALQAFKDWVHAYLDVHGVPKEFPDGKHTREGCRVGDRMEHVFAELEGLRDRVGCAVEDARVVKVPQQTHPSPRVRR